MSAAPVPTKLPPAQSKNPVQGAVHPPNPRPPPASSPHRGSVVAEAAGADTHPVARRLRKATDIWELRAAARRVMPRAVFDYVDGAAEDEVSLRRVRMDYRRAEFLPRALRDVSSVDPSTTLLGDASALPLALAPTGYTRMMHHDGEIAVARAATRLSLPYALSTVGTTSPEELRAAAPEAHLWFQLYLWKDRNASRRLVERARDAGFSSLILTVDTPVSGNRQRDLRNGLTVPPQLSLGTLADMASHPTWWVN